MTNKIKEMKGLGLPNPSTTTNLMKFMGREAYLKELEDTMRSEVVKFPKETTPQGIVDCIKQLANLRALLNSFSHSKISSKYEILTKL